MTGSPVHVRLVAGTPAGFKVYADRRYVRPAFGPGVYTAAPDPPLP
ncbi:hypothetical protein ACOZ38_14045 [Sphaerisporangium viridialbum]